MTELATEQEMLDVSTETGERLSWREHQVISLIAEGATDREIAEVLYLAESTVAADVRRLRSKLGARNRAHAVTLWLRSSGPLPPPAVRRADRAQVKADRRSTTVDDVLDLLPGAIAQLFESPSRRKARPLGQ